MLQGLGYTRDAMTSLLLKLGIPVYPSPGARSAALAALRQAAMQGSMNGTSLIAVRCAKFARTGRDQSSRNRTLKSAGRKIFQDPT